MVESVPGGYSSAKQAILVALKQRSEASLAELATALGRSKVAVLGHVARLESDGLVDRSYRAGKVGRPRVVFRLTEAAASMFPHSYVEMSRSAFEFIEERLGRAGVRELLARRAAEVAARNRARIPSGPLHGRVAELARIRTEGGYMAEVGGRRRRSVELLEHNCPILALADRYPEACETEREMFRSLLGADVSVTHRVVAGDAVCRFLVREPPRET